VRPLQTGFAQNWLECTGELITGPYFYPSPVASGDLSLQTIMSSPETGASTVRVMYCMAISAARATIDIANPYFVPDHVSIDLFRDAVKRGVRVRVMVAGTSNDNIMARLNSVRLYGAVIEAGVELYEYNRTMLHHKIMIVDGLWSTVGTSNFDNRSFSHNEENNVSAVNAGLAQSLLASFERDLAACDPITFDEWKRRNIVHKVFEGLASFAQDQV
jgi:cardiolipin synthase